MTEEQELQIKIGQQAYLEQIFKGHTITRCPQCGGEIIVEISGNSHNIECPCGFMHTVYRGL